MPYKSLQESKRETWELFGAEVVLDIWPWLNPYIEIEGKSENQLKEITKLLGFNWEDAVFGDVMSAYRSQHPHLKTQDTVGNIAVVKLNDPLPELLSNVKKNK